MIIPGGAPAPTLVGFDSNLLASYYASGAALERSVLVGALRAQGLERGPRDGPAAIPPWDIPDTAGEDKLLERLFSAEPKLEAGEGFAGDDADSGALFALWRGLSRLRELAQYAETGARADSLRPLLERRFQSYLEEVRSYAAGLELPDITVVPGSERGSIETTTPLPKPIEKTLPEHIGQVLTTVREDAIPGLVGNETFTIELETSTGSQSVAIDLAGISGTLNVDNVAAHINDALESAGALTRITVERFHEFAYGFRLQMSSAETVTFTPDAGGGEAGLLLAGGSGGGNSADGFLRKLDDLGAAAPVEGFISAISTDQGDQAAGTAVDSFGNVYVVGTTSGDLGDQVNQSTPDAFLQKYDAAGTLLWSRLLGAGETAAGAAIAIDGDDNVVIAGEVQGLLTGTAVGGGKDSFVTKFDGDGRELWTRQTGPVADDGALALATNAAGDIFLAGTTHSALDATVSHAGGGDAYLRKLDTDGAIVWSKQFGSAGEDRATALAVDAAGDILLAGEVDGQAVLRKYADSDAGSAPIWEVDLGSLGTGQVSGLALGEGGALYIAGAIDGAGLNGAIVQAHSGGSDGFVTRVTDSGASAAIDWLSHVGGSGDDFGLGLAVKADATGDEIYLSGSTASALAPGGQVGAIDGFAAKLDDTGATLWTQQFGGAFAHSARAVAYDDDASSVITRLGLPTTALPLEPAREIVNLTSARAGQSFELAVDGGAFRRVEIEADDSFTFLSLKINSLLGAAGTARYESDVDGMRLRIEAAAGSLIELRAGPGTRDALAPIGLAPVTLFDGGEAVGDDLSPGDGEGPRVFALGLFAGLGLDGGQAAQDAGFVLEDAMRTVQEIHDRLLGVPESDPLADLAALTPSPADQARIDALRTALLRLSSGGPAGTFSLTV